MRGWRNAFLTPNRNEFQRLASAFDVEVDPKEPRQAAAGGASASDAHEKSVSMLQPTCCRHTMLPIANPFRCLPMQRICTPPCWHRLYDVTRHSHAPGYLCGHHTLH